MLHEINEIRTCRCSSVSHRLALALGHHTLTPRSALKTSYRKKKTDEDGIFWQTRGIAPEGESARSKSRLRASGHRQVENVGRSAE
jgi:hypothetical protein